MKVLFLHPNTPDYLSAGLFHGLRTVLGANCVDLPRFDCMYAPLSDGMRGKIRGKGFTLYGLLPDMPELAEERFFIWFKNIKDFDRYIIADIWNHWDVYQQLKRLVDPEKIIVIDPSDSTRIFPNNNHRQTLLNNILSTKQPFHHHTKYYKRELNNKPDAMVGLPTPISLLLQFKLPSQIYPISFSIPEEKITVVEAHTKTKQFTNNMVDEEVAKKLQGTHFIPLGVEKYNFETEQEYYSDIRQSRFGITGKRSGWDCLRHYELAANGAILCFKHLQNKPPLSAPHQLDHTNSIAYSHYEDLMEKIEALSHIDYGRMLANGYQWIFDHTTTALAQRILKNI